MASLATSGETTGRVGITFLRFTGANRDPTKYSSRDEVPKRFASGATASYAARLLLCIRCAYTTKLTVEWDEEKRRPNFQKHRVEFADAVTALDDNHAITVSDDDRAEEERFVTLAADAEGRILLSSFTPGEARRYG